MCKKNDTQENTEEAPVSRKRVSVNKLLDSDIDREKGAGFTYKVGNIITAHIAKGETEDSEKKVISNRQSGIGKGILELDDTKDKEAIDALVVSCTFVYDITIEYSEGIAKEGKAKFRLASKKLQALVDFHEKLGEIYKKESTSSAPKEFMPKNLF